MLKKGFSLIEFIIVMLILGIIAGFGASWLSKGLQSGIYSTRLVERTWQARLALQRIANDILYLINFSNTSTYAALNFTDVNGTATTYVLSGNNIQRNGYNVVSNITSLSFNYVNSSYNYTTNLDTVMCIYIYANVTFAKGSSSMGGLPLQTIVCPRNL